MAAPRHELGQRLMTFPDIPLDTPLKCTSFNVEVGGKAIRLGPGTLTVFAAGRQVGKSVAHLIGKKLMPFHEWKEAFRKLEAPRVRERGEYHSLYGRYCESHRLANPPGGFARRWLSQ